MKADFALRIMQRIPDMVAFLDTELRFRFVNDAYRKTLGLSEKEIIGKTVYDVLPAQIIAMARPQWQQALRGQEVAHDAPIELEGETTRWVLARMMPEFEDDGSVAGFFVILTDVTARKNAETGLQRLRALNDDLPTPLAHCDAQERYLYVNRAYATLYGQTPDGILGSTIQEVLPHDLYKRVQPYIKTLLRGEPIEFETFFPEVDGIQPWMSIRGIPERLGNDIVGFFVNIADISKHKELDKLRSEFTSATVRAQEAERKALAQELHDGIAQELAALAVISNMLERKAETTKAGAVFRMLQEGLQRTVHETRRLSYGLHPLELTERGLIKAIEELLNRTRQVHSNVTINFAHNSNMVGTPSGPDTDIAVYRIIQEGISNALRHAAPSQINLSLTRQDDLLVGRIIDNGTGFEMTSPLAGFGLASMRERATLLAGSLSIESGPAGTAIEFRLPTTQNSEIED